MPESINVVPASPPAPDFRTNAPAVVIADDDEVARELILRLLKKLNLRNSVLLAGDGLEALSLMAEVTPALVLLDLDMPRMSGLEVLAQMRATPRLHRSPVVVLTGSAGLSDVDRAYELGVASYLTKPVGFSALRDVISGLPLPWLLLPPD